MQESAIEALARFCAKVRPIHVLGIDILASGGVGGREAKIGVLCWVRLQELSVLKDI